jgi:site-specific recombinase XerD
VQLVAATAAFFADLALGRSPSTVAAYRYALARFTEYLAARDRLPDDVAGLSIDHVVEFTRWILAVPGSSRKTCDVYVSALSVFYGYLVREDLRPDLPLEKLRLRLRPLLSHRPAPLPRVPPDATVERLVAAARAHDGQTKHGALPRLRNVALVETLLGSGLRVGELVALRRSDLAAGDRSAVVTGKGGKQRLVYFSPAAAEAIGAYLAARRDEPPAAPLFCRHDHAAEGRRPLTRGAVRWLLASLGRSAGLGDPRVTPHRLRAWFATHVLEQTGDLAATQDLLGHASPHTTRLYARLADPRLRELHARAFPDRPGAVAHA